MGKSRFYSDRSACSQVRFRRDAVTARFYGIRIAFTKRCDHNFAGFACCTDTVSKNLSQLFDSSMWLKTIGRHFRAGTQKGTPNMIEPPFLSKPVRNRLKGLVLLSCAGFALNAGAAQADDLYRTDYEISIFGLSIARAATETTVSGSRYNLNGNFKTSGLARVFDDTAGTVHVTGNAVKGKVIPSTFDLNYKHGRKNKRTTIRFANGNVVAAENQPPVKKRDPWVETSPQDLLNVSDALSALMIPATDPSSVCNRTLSVFDGQTRADIKLSFNGTESFTADGFTGESVICSAKFIPISGYQKGKKSIDYLANKSRISVSFASLGDSGIYAPVVARIGTQIGTLKISASRFEKVN